MNLNLKHKTYVEYPLEDLEFENRLIEQQSKKDMEMDPLFDGDLK